MIQHNVSLAFKHLRKTAFHTLISVVGLVIGITSLLSISLYTHHERGYDRFFRNWQHIYSIGSEYSENSNNSGQTANTFTALAPLLPANLTNVSGVSRALDRTIIISTESNTHFWQTIKFVDHDFFKIFDLSYIEGSTDTLLDPQSIAISKSLALRLFGSLNVIDKDITIRDNISLTVKAIVEDLPQQTHFRDEPAFANGGFAFAHSEILSRLDGWDPAGDWYGISSNDMTYVLVNPDSDSAVLAAQINQVYERNAPDFIREKFVTQLHPLPLGGLHTRSLDVLNLPLLDVLQALGFIILMIAIINYSNLSVAHNLSRTREIGIRKALGASRQNLLSLFFTESFLVTAIAAGISLLLVTLLLPVFNETFSSGLSLAPVDGIIWFLFLTSTVGLLGGIYPALTIAKTPLLDAIRKLPTALFSLNKLKLLLLSLQFMASFLMLTFVTTVFMQNSAMERDAQTIARHDLLVIDRMWDASIYPQQEALKSRLEAIPSVTSLTYTNQLPFDQNNSTFDVASTLGDDANKVSANFLTVDDDFLNTFDIPLVAGRGLTFDNLSDYRQNWSETKTNVLINRVLANKLGFDSPQKSLGEVFYDFREGQSTEYRIAGVIEDLNYQGLQNSIKPWLIFMVEPREARNSKMAIRVNAGANPQVFKEIEHAWEAIFPDQPFSYKLLDDSFQLQFKRFDDLFLIIGVFAFIGVFLALIGMYGLTAFVIQSRLKEIGIRKLLGASTNRISFEISKGILSPLATVFLLSMPISYHIGNRYLEYFAGVRSDALIESALSIGLILLTATAGIVLTHVVRASRQNLLGLLRND